MNQYKKLLEKRKRELVSRYNRRREKEKKQPRFRTKMNVSATTEIERELSSTLKKGEYNSSHFTSIKQRASIK